MSVVVINSQRSCSKYHHGRWCRQYGRIGHVRVFRQDSRRFRNIAQGDKINDDHQQSTGYGTAAQDSEMTMFAHIFIAITLLLLAAALAAHLQQPFVVIFIAVGVLARPMLLGWISPNHQVGLEVTRLGQNSSATV